MKVLQIVKTNKGATWAFFQAIKLKEKGVELVLMLPNDVDAMANKYKENGIEVIGFDASLPLRKPWTFLARSKQLKRVINQIQPDIIHTHFVTNTLFVRLSLRNSKILRVFQVPGPLHLEKNFYRKLDIKTSINKVDYWIPTCQYSYNAYLKENVDPDRLSLIYYGGYGGKMVDKYQNSIGKLHREFNLSKDVKLVGMISYFYKPSIFKGQIRGIKGHEDFFDAMEIVTRDYPNVKAIVIGGPWGNCKGYEKKMKKYAKKKLGNNVIFTGFRNDLTDIYKEIDIAVHPSHSENLGGAAESLAAGVPTITTNIGGFPDIVHDGKTGYLVEKASPKQLAYTIEKMLGDYNHSKKMAAQGKLLVKELLDIEKTSDKIFNFYQKIMEKI